MKTITKIHIRKERLKFSSAHMTVFEDGTKEALHGHNYETELTIETKGFVSYSIFKEALEKITAKWDEKVLLATQGKYFQESKADKGNYAFSLCKKKYSLPKDEVVLLPTDNITAEALSQIALEQLIQILPQKYRELLISITLRIDESKGQGASTTWSAEEC